ncbi:MAG: ethanolamine ammonia-lyase light chain EutC, partial [Planctomycetaceae bacterium]
MDDPAVPAPRSGPVVTPDPWQALRSLTPARLALGRAGHALPTRERLACDAAHARARAAVSRPLDVDVLCDELAPLIAPETPLVLSAAAADRARSLLRPDRGRRLANESRRRLEQCAREHNGSD